MSATVAAALKKAAVYILGDEKKRGDIQKIFCHKRNVRGRSSGSGGHLKAWRSACRGVR